MEKVSSANIGRYEIIRVLGRGRKGEVILAQDKNLGRRVAIRRAAHAGETGGLARFRFEAKAATLRHPNIPIVYEIGVHQDHPFIAMEYVEGETLAQVIESKRELDLISRLRIIEQVCSALGYAHEKGVIHLDVRPANIIVQPDGAAKLIDFGMAAPANHDPDFGPADADRDAGSLLTSPGKPRRVDGREDIFSAGVTLFKLLTGENPSTVGDAAGAFLPLDEAHAHLDNYPPALEEIVARSLARHPADSFQTAEDFADALRGVIKGLNRTRVAELFDDAERQNSEGRVAPALALLDQAIRLDPSHAPARNLRKIIRDEEQSLRRAERLREHLDNSDEALLAGRLDEALNHLRNAQALEPSSAELETRISAVEEKKRRIENSARTLAAAGEAKMRGDAAGALRMIAAALEEDPDNHQLVAMNSALLRQLEIEAQRSRLLELQENSARALAVRDYDRAESLLGEASAIDPSNPDTRRQSRELARARQLEHRTAVLQNIEQRVHDLIRADAFEQAADLIDQALNRLPGEPLLHRLKAQVDAEASRYDVRRIVDLTIAQANELLASSPPEALRIVRTMLDNMPGEERLLALERSLRRRVEAK
jgi:serine/threonine protein kinase